MTNQKEPTLLGKFFFAPIEDDIYLVHQYPESIYDSELISFEKDFRLVAVTSSGRICMDSLVQAKKCLRIRQVLEVLNAREKEAVSLHVVYEDSKTGLSISPLRMAFDAVWFYSLMIRKPLRYSRMIRSGDLERLRHQQY